MAMLDDVAQKIQGKGQKMKGRMRNDPVRGTIDQVKGGINETIADAKLRNRNNRSRG